MEIRLELRQDDLQDLVALTLPRKGHWRWALRAIGPLLFCLLLWRADLAPLQALWQSMNPLLPSLALLSVIPVLWLRVQRWRLMMTPFHRAISLGEALGAYGLAVLAGTFTPGQVGELAKIYLARRKGIPLEQAVFASLADRVLDLVLLLVVGSHFLAVTVGPGSALPPAALLCLLVLLPWVAGRLPRIAGDPDSRSGKWLQRLRSLARDFPELGARVQVLVLGQTLLAWLLNWLAIYLCARGLGLGLSFYYLTGAMAMCSLLSILPISILGVGTRDAVLVFFLGRAGYGEAQALALSSLVLVLRLAYTGACAAVLAMPGWKPPTSEPEPGAGGAGS